MLFQSTVLLALASSIFALPAPEPKLVARAQIPAGGVNCDGATFSVCILSRLQFIYPSSRPS